MQKNIKWNFLKITIPYVMGQLSEKKLNYIVGNLNTKGFIAKINMIDPGMTVIALEEDKKRLIIESRQITYSTKLEGDLEQLVIQKQFESILDALLIDDKNQYFFNIEGISETQDSHTESRIVYEEKHMLLEKDIYGVGYRFLIKNENLFGELKIEPLIADKSKYYYEWLLNKVENVSIAKLLADVKNEIEKDRECCYNVIRR